MDTRHGILLERRQGRPLHVCCQCSEKTTLVDSSGEPRGLSRDAGLRRRCGQVFRTGVDLELRFQISQETVLIQSAEHPGIFNSQMLRFVQYTRVYILHAWN